MECSHCELNTELYEVNLYVCIETVVHANMFYSNVVGDPVQQVYFIYHFFMYKAKQSY